jgi:sterol desaturase/sphingolipid hydroxylase (fatty acid hydroxylase superfamily)
MIPESLFDSAVLAKLASGVALIAFLFAIVFVLEMRFAGDLKRYRTRAFATDLAYALVYLGGIYSLLVSAPVLAAISLLVPDSWRLSLLSGLPPVAGFAVFWILGDAIQYWIHRWEHRNPALWRLHSVHHSQTTLTFATSWRNHVLEQLFINVLMFVPLLLLGMPAWYWLPAVLLQYLFEALQHSDLNWRYGRLYPVVVSPVFHAIHHARERERHDTNYGKILGVWDWMFGTLSRGDRPARYGVAGMNAPVTFWQTVVAPFGSSAPSAPPQDDPEARQPVN